MSDNPIFQQIESDIQGNDVVLYMKGTKDIPMCGFSSVVVQILQHENVEFLDRNVLDSNDLREGIKEFTNWPTIPQLYVKGEFVGGADILREMFESGELSSLLADKGVKAA